MDLIDREALIKTVEQAEGLSWDSFDKQSFCVRRKFIDSAPTVAEDYDTGYQDGLEDGLNDIRPKGEWIEHRDRTYCKYGCNQCGNLVKSRSSFCPDCGADMRGEKK